MKEVLYLNFPRPDFRRENWMDLSGMWEFAFDEDWKQGENGLSEKVYPRKIEVPFAYQTPRSGIHIQEIHEVIWYKRSFIISNSMRGKRVFLNFAAVDYEAYVWLNGQLLGSHQGGYTPFSFEITQYLKEENEVVLKVKDEVDTAQPRGKQYWTDSPDRCWYTPTSGIWQMVWIETVDQKPIDHVKIVPDIDTNSVLFGITVPEYCQGDKVELTIFYKEKMVKEAMVSLDGKRTEVIIALKPEDSIDEIHHWSPEKPNLYDVQLTLLHNGEKLDRIETYFGMRKIAVDEGKLLLNNHPYYFKMILDQGYWEESGLTPPSMNALLHDVVMTKSYGYNGARKHQKIEDPRYYYLADVLGLVVWGEMPSGYEFCDDEIGNISRDFQEFIRRDGNHPCIVAWVPLNESWGVRKIVSNTRQQEFAKMLYHMAKAYDSQRLVSTNDGWENVEADIISIHDYSMFGEEILGKYTKEVLESPETLTAGNRRLFAFGEKARKGKQVIMVTEYGGIAMEKDTSGSNWGYGKTENDANDVIRRYQDVTCAIMKIPGCYGFCYTQLTDVYQEVNGLMDMRHETKLDPAKIRQIHEMI